VTHTDRGPRSRAICALHKNQNSTIDHGLASAAIDALLPVDVWAHNLHGSAAVRRRVGGSRHPSCVNATSLLASLDHSMAHRVSLTLRVRVGEREALRTTGTFALAAFAGRALQSARSEAASWQMAASPLVPARRSLPFADRLVCDLVY